MGNAESHDTPRQNGNDDGDHYYDEDDAVRDDPFEGIETLGYRVLGVQPDSPAAKAGLVSFLDFLVGVNGQMLLGSGEHLQPGEEYDDVDLPAVLQASKGQELEFLVWNMKSQSARLVHLTPRDDWGGAGLLGVTIRLDDYAGAEDRLVRVLTVEPGSPADIAGLQPETDFLLGTTHQTLDSVDRLANAVLRPNMNRVVELYVYNTVTDMVRVVALMPTYNWGGDGVHQRGLLGAEVGTGYLHRLPHTARGTAGSSVERKVRYVDVVEEPAGGGDGANPKVRQQKLELEPQLEMEPDDDDEVESVALTGNDKKQDDPKPATSNHHYSSSSASANAAPTDQLNAKLPARAPSSYGLQPLEVQAVFQKPPPTAAPECSASSPTTVQGSYSNESTSRSGNNNPYPPYNGGGATPSYHHHQQQYGPSQVQPHPFAPQRATSYNYQQPGPPPVPTYQQKSSPAARAAATGSSGDNPYSAAKGPLKPAAPSSGDNHFLVPGAPRSGNNPPFVAAPVAASAPAGTHAFTITPPPQMSLYGSSQHQPHPASSPSFSSSYASSTYGGGGTYGAGGANQAYAGGAPYNFMSQPPPPVRGFGATAPYSASST